MSAICQRTDVTTDRLTGVIDLEAVRVDRLVAVILPELEATGVARAPHASSAEADRWRAAARRAARKLGWRVRTGVSGEYVWAASEDWLPGPGADWRAARTFASLIENRDA